MGVGTLQRAYINLGGTVANIAAIRWGFRHPAGAYTGIAAGLGVNLVTDADSSGIVYGANAPKPVRVRITYKVAAAGGGGAGGTANDVSRSVRRLCEPDKLNSVLFGGLNAAKVNVVDLDDGGTTEYDIDNVTLA